MKIIEFELIVKSSLDKDFLEKKNIILYTFHKSLNIPPLITALSYPLSLERANNFRNKVQNVAT